MTGTGTQSDPYVPVTLTEFIEAVGTSGAYVALDRDIDAAEDPNYGGEITNTIAVNAVSVNGEGHEIAGVTVRAKNCMNIYTRRATMKNIYFRNLCHKRTEVGTTFNGIDDQMLEGFDGCKFSLSTNAASGWQKLFSLLRFKNCAIDVDCTGAGSGDLMELDQFEGCTVILHGIAANSVCKTITLNRSAIIFDADVLTASPVFASLNGQYSYVANKKHTGNTINFATGSTTGCVLAVVEGQAVAGVPSGTAVGTLDQMRDEAWLASVGFLP